MRGPLPGTGEVRGQWTVGGTGQYGVRGETFSVAVPEIGWVPHGVLLTTRGSVTCVSEQGGVLLTDSRAQYRYDPVAETWVVLAVLGHVVLAWDYTPGVPQAQRFVVQRQALPEGPVTTVAVVEPVLTRPASYTAQDSAVVVGQTYRWWVQAEVEAAQSAASVPVELTIPYPVVAPVRLTATYKGET